jgi:putative membrane protein
MKFPESRIAVLATAVFLLPAVAAAHAQQNPANVRMAPGDNPNIQGNNGVGDDPQSMRDSAFLHRALEGGMGEIEISKLAAEKASSDSVKELAQKLVDDHTAMKDKLEPVAASSGVKPPKKLAKADQQELTKLSGLTGQDFDREYLAYELKAHHRDLSDFRTEAAAASKPQLKDAASKGAGMIQEHTDELAKLSSSDSNK